MYYNEEFGKWIYSVKFHIHLRIWPEDWLEAVDEDEINMLYDMLKKGQLTFEKSCIIKEESE